MKLHNVLDIVFVIGLIAFPPCAQVLANQNTDSPETQINVYLDRDDLWGRYYSGLYLNPNSFFANHDQRVYTGILGLGLSKNFLFQLSSNLVKSMDDMSYMPKALVGIRPFPFIQLTGSYEDPDAVIFNERSSNPIFDSYDKLEFEANPNWNLRIQTDSKLKGTFNTLFHPALMYQFPNQPYIHVLNENGFMRTLM